MPKFRIVCEIKVIDENDVVVDHRGFEPRRENNKPVGEQKCSAFVGGTDYIRNANTMMNSMFSIVNSVRTIHQME